MADIFKVNILNGIVEEPDGYNYEDWRSYVITVIYEPNLTVTISESDDDSEAITILKGKEAAQYLMKFGSNFERVEN